MPLTSMDRPPRTAPPKKHVLRVRVTEYQNARVRDIAIRKQMTMTDVVIDAIERYDAEGVR